MWSRERYLCRPATSFNSIWLVLERSHSECLQWACWFQRLLDFSVVSPWYCIWAEGWEVWKTDCFTLRVVSPGEGIHSLCGVGWLIKLIINKRVLLGRSIRPDISRLIERIDCMAGQLIARRYFSAWPSILDAIVSPQFVGGVPATVSGICWLCFRCLPLTLLCNSW